MKSLMRVLCVMALIAVVATPLSAQDKKKKKKRNQRQGNSQIQRQLAKVELNDEQKEKIKKIVTEYQPKIVAARKALALTAEQRKAGQEAGKKADDEGVKGRQKAQAVLAAQKLTDAQKEARQEQQQLNAAMRKAIAGVLTAEQIKEAGIRVAGQRKKKKKKDG